VVVFDEVKIPTSKPSGKKSANADGASAIKPSLTTTRELRSAAKRSANNDGSDVAGGREAKVASV
jgi:hypothetical protein